MATEAATAHRLPVDEASRLAVSLLETAGVPESSAQIQAELLIDAEVKGHPSHGLLRLPLILQRIRNGLLNPHSTGNGTWSSSAFLSVDGGQGLGPVVARKALNALLDRAQETAVAVAAITANNHLGMLAWHIEHVVRSGFAVLGMTTSEALVHPYGGRRALIGTNPISLGLPAEPQPFILDLATSEVPMGRIAAHALRNEPLLPGWAIDRDGEPTLDPQAARNGAISPFGGAKGYGLALGIELLVASLAGSALGTDVTGTLDATHSANKGDVFIVFAPRRSPSFLADYLQSIRDSGHGRAVLVPGDRARAHRERALTHGIDVPASLITELEQFHTNFIERLK